VKGWVGLAQQIWLGVVVVTCEKVAPMLVHFFWKMAKWVQPEVLQSRQTELEEPMEGVMAGEAPTDPEALTARTEPETLTAWLGDTLTATEAETLAARLGDTLAAIFEGEMVAFTDLEKLARRELETLDLRDFETLATRELDTLDFKDLEGVGTNAWVQVRRADPVVALQVWLPPRTVQSWSSFGVLAVEGQVVESSVQEKVKGVTTLLQHVWFLASVALLISE